MIKDEAYYMAMAEFLDEVFFNEPVKDEKDELAYKGDNIEIRRIETKDKIILELRQ